MFEIFFIFFEKHYIIKDFLNYFQTIFLFHYVLKNLSTEQLSKHDPSYG